MGSLKLHNVRVRAVYNGSIHDRFARIRLLLKNIHGQLHHFVPISRINKSCIEHIVKHQFKPVSFAGQGINANKNHFLFTSGFLRSLIGSRSDTVVMCIYRINLRMTAKHTIHFHFCRFTFPGSIRFINQFDIRIIADSSHKSLMAFHGRGGTTQSGKLHYIPFPFQT